MLSMNLLHLGLLMSLVGNLYSINDTRKWKSRKITDGKPVEKDPQYMVYLTKAEKSQTQYDAWICGGAIVSKDFIVTSAACVEDVQFMYAISGYSKYVNVKNIDSDECTKASRKKIVFICVPKRYDFAYDKIQKWAFIDIAAVKVESPYDFSAPKLPGCSWTPKKIDINYEARYQAPDVDAIVLGWGHVQKWRSPGDPKDYNQQELQYGSIRTMEKAKCKEMYSKTPDLIPIIDKYMICAMGEGNLDDKGDQKEVKKSKADGCPPGSLRIGDDCQKQYEMREQKSYFDSPPTAIRPTLFNYQKNYQSAHNNYPKNKIYASQPSVSEDSISFEDIILNVRRSDVNDSKPLNYTRKAGICQNDHGGPLVTWVGTHERLIGVASVFRLDKSMSCVGPYLFTSTQCNGGFLDCVINGDEESKADYPDGSHKDTDKSHNPNTGGQTDASKDNNPGSGPINSGKNDGKKKDKDLCDEPPAKKGFDLIRRRISWRNHPDGPAANELLPYDLFARPVKPIG